MVPKDIRNASILPRNLLIIQTEGPYKAGDGPNFDSALLPLAPSRCSMLHFSTVTGPPA